MSDFLFSVDKNLFFFLNTIFSNDLLDYFFKFITDSNHLYLMFLIAGIVFVINKKVEALKIVGVVILAMGISDLIGGQILKPFFHRMRPCHPSYFIEGKHMFLEGANFLFGMKKGASFPSNHAMNIFAFATVLSLYFPKNFFYYYIFAILVAFSRIYVGVHYPSDVIGGTILGISIGMLIYYMIYYIKNDIISRRYRKNLIREVIIGNE